MSVLESQRKKNRADQRHPPPPKKLSSVKMVRGKVPKYAKKLQLTKPKPRPEIRKSNAANVTIFLTSGKYHFPSEYPSLTLPTTTYGIFHIENERYRRSCDNLPFGRPHRDKQKNITDIQSNCLRKEVTWTWSVSKLSEFVENLTKILKGGISGCHMQGLPHKLWTWMCSVAHHHLMDLYGKYLCGVV